MWLNRLYLVHVHPLHVGLYLSGERALPKRQGAHRWAEKVALTPSVTLVCGSLGRSSLSGCQESAPFIWTWALVFQAPSWRCWSGFARLS